MQDIDLENPGSITGSASNAKDYVFYIVRARAWYSEAAFAANPNCVAGGDLFFKSPVVPDAGGKAAVELAAKANELKHKMKDEGKIRVKVVTLVTAKPENEDPAARLAVVEDCALKKIPPTIEISTDGDKREFVVGTRLTMKFLVKGIDEAAIRCEPPGAFKLPKDKLTKTEFLDIEAPKAVKATVFCSGMSIGGNKIEAKIEIEAVGPSLKLVESGYINSGKERDIGDYKPPPPVPKPSLDAKTEPAELKKLAFGQTAKVSVEFANVGSVQITAEPPDAVVVSVSALSEPGSVEVTPQKDAHVTLTIAGGGLTKKFEFDTEGPAPSIELEKPEAEVGGEVKIALQGPAGEDYTLLFNALEKRSPLGKLDGDGRAVGAVKLDPADFKAGKYTVLFKTAGGKESNKVELEVK